MSVSETVKLELIAAERTTEIDLFDHDLKRVAQGRGSVVTNVAPGIYKLRFLAGDGCRDQLIEVPRGSTDLTVRGKPVEFTSAVPLAGTLDTHEYQRYPASALSRKVFSRIGGGAEIFLFVRDPKLDGQPRPADTVQLLDVSGAIVFDLRNASTNETERWGGANLEVDPGTYRLRVDTGQLGTYETFLVASPDWQTQAFLAVDEVREGTRTERRPRLSSASVMMSRRGRGFDSDDARDRLAELARQALGTRRNIVTSDLLFEMLDEKVGNPMFGILGAHLLSREPDPDRALVGTVCARLRSLIGAHPDVVALELDGAALSSASAFETPPMLYSSWERIVAATQTRSELVPRGSLSDRIADAVIPRGPWLIWLVNESTARGVHRAPLDRVSLDWVSDFVTRVGGAGTRDLDAWLRKGNRQHQISSLGQNVLSALSSVASRAEPGSAQPDPAAIVRQLAVDLRVPVSSIERTATDLATTIASFKGTRF